MKILFYPPYNFSNVTSTSNFSRFVEDKLGTRFVENRSMEFSKSFEESGPTSPIFFILSPGVNPLKDVETLGQAMGYTQENGKFNVVSLGQGQEPVAEEALERASQNGHWLMLQVGQFFALIGVYNYTGNIHSLYYTFTVAKKIFQIHKTQTKLERQ